MHYFYPAFTGTLGDLAAAAVISDEGRYNIEQLWLILSGDTDKIIYGSMIDRKEQNGYGRKEERYSSY
mgnify:CR=1 FL=1